MKSLPPGAWLGLLGGGQLGRMFCMAAQSLGYKVVVLDPGSDSPAGSVADRHIRADYLDPQGLAELAALAAAATTEFENVPAAALEFLAHTARASSRERSTANGATAKPCPARNIFSLIRSWAMATLAAAGVTRAVRARNSSAVAGTFSNSVVAACATAARSANPAGSR